MYSRWLKWGICALVIALLAGCANGSAHVSLRKDGSADLDMKVTLKESTQKLVGGKLGEMLQAKAEELGIDYETREQGTGTDYLLHKSFGSLQEGIKQWNFADQQNIVKTTKHFFYTRVEIRLTVDIGKYLDPLIRNQDLLKVPDTLIKLALSQLNLDFLLTLPISTFGNNNADQVDGHTMKWDLSMTKPTEIQFAFLIPNIKHILIGAGILLVAAVVLVILLIRRITSRKRRKKAMSVPPPEERRDEDED
ncbi:hypothetical protein ACFOLF_18670 [Paenibacillus sepulcri]|uniref:DUF3153 domain-containing protein n=1 Tax=Paenibacillus sepulcri TaxID=359917 RepID=A0ABS7CBA3_9BACL|nr:hypothetical protein [Paenibacillus sepulcri]